MLSEVFRDTFRRAGPARVFHSSKLQAAESGALPTDSSLTKPLRVEPSIAFLPEVIIVPYYCAVCAFASTSTESAEDVS